MTSLATLKQGALGPLQHSTHRTLTSPTKSQVTSHRTPSPRTLPSTSALGLASPHALLPRGQLHKSELCSSQIWHTPRVPVSAWTSCEHSQGGGSKGGPGVQAVSKLGIQLAVTEDDRKVPAQQAAETLALSWALWLLTAVSGALCEEAAESADSVESAADAALDALPSWFGEFVLVIPLLAYAIFYFIRARVSCMHFTARHCTALCFAGLCCAALH